jgi:hypothetical protein
LITFLADVAGSFGKPFYLNIQKRELSSFGGQLKQNMVVLFKAYLQIRVVSQFN